MMPFASSRSGLPYYNTVKVQMDCDYYKIEPVATVNWNCKANDIILNYDNKYLVIHIDSTLKWIPQIDSMCRKPRRFIYVFKISRKIAVLKTLISTYNGLVRSILRSGGVRPKFVVGKIHFAKPFDTGSEFDIDWSSSSKNFWFWGSIRSCRWCKMNNNITIVKCFLFLQFWISHFRWYIKLPLFFRKKKMKNVFIPQ